MFSNFYVKEKIMQISLKVSLEFLRVVVVMVTKYKKSGVPERISPYLLSCWFIELFNLRFRHKLTMGYTQLKSYAQGSL